MPVQKQFRVVVAERGGGIHIGDQIMLPRGITGLVESLETKATYQHVTLVGGTRGRFPIGSEVNVTREVPTDTEQDNEELQKIAERVSRVCFDSKNNLETSLDRLNDRFTEHMLAGHMDPFNLEMAAGIKSLEMTWRLWSEVENWIDELSGRPDTNPGTEALRAVMRVRHQCEKELTRRGSVRSLSRSTSVIANLEDDMMREVRIEFLDTTRYWGVDELWERTGGIL